MEQRLLRCHILLSHIVRNRTNTGMMKHGEGLSGLHRLEEATQSWKTQSGRGDQGVEDAVVGGGLPFPMEHGRGGEDMVNPGDATPTPRQA